MKSDVGGVVVVGHQDAFCLKMRSVKVFCEDRIMLASGMGIVVVSRMLDVARIVGFESVRSRYRATGIDAAAVESLVGSQRRRQVFVIDEVAGPVVSPVIFLSGLYIGRIVLEEDMVRSLIFAQSVRIVEPSRRRHQMEAQTPVVSGGFFRCFFFELSDFFCAQ